MQQNQPPIITIKMVPAGVELVLNALNQLPRGQVEGLWQEIAGQYTYQMQELQKAAQAAQAAEAAQAPAAAETAPEAPSDDAGAVSPGGTE
jgi:hypothetical protein